LRPTHAPYVGSDDDLAGVVDTSVAFLVALRSVIDALDRFRDAKAPVEGRAGVGVAR
jgi:hypothetical protein